MASFNDLTPKLGVAYDLFGTGRTAIKASYSRYVEQMSYGGTFGESATPPLRTVQSVTRPWIDGDADFTPDCELLTLQARLFGASGDAHPRGDAEGVLVEQRR